MPWSYCSREELKRRRADTATTDDTTYLEVLEAVAVGIDDECQTTFQPQWATRYFMPDRWDRVFLDADLLSLTTLAVDWGFDQTFSTVWDVTDYLLKPYNAPARRRPYWEIERRIFSGQFFLTGVPRSAKVVGKWGYWEDLTAVGTLGAAITTTTTTAVTMAAGHGVECGHTILVDDEQVYVSNVATNTLTVERAVNGTTAATHLNAAAVQRYRYPSTVVEASVIQASRIFMRKDSPFGVTGSADMGTSSLIVRLDPDVKQYLQRYRSGLGMVA